jgi:hypothetical protein
MRAETELDRQLEFLRSRVGAGVAHSWSSLLEHLTGTRAILLSWEADPAVCTAGLFHSVYGTESFDQAMIARGEREAVRSTIGEESEELVYLFSVMTGQSFEAAIDETATHRINDRIAHRWIDVPHPVFVGLCNLGAANWLEQRPRLGDAYAELGRDRYRAMLPLVLPAARSALRSAYRLA